MKIGPKEKYCRKFGYKMLWNDRCASAKCGLLRRRQRPGMHGHKPRVLSLYGKQLLEKQRLKLSYLLNETKLKNYVLLAKKSKKTAPDALIELLERRLDNVIWRAGYASSKLAARQLVSHGHFLVNGRKIKSHSYLVNKDDVIEIRPQSKNIKPFENIHNKLKFYQSPSWLEVDKENLKITVVKLPEATEIQHTFNLPLVIDFYSRQ